MKTSLLLLSIFVLFSGCMSPDTTKLKIGMTKDDVIKIMGKPVQVSSDQGKEIFTYHIPTKTVSTRRSSGFGPNASTAIRKAPSTHTINGVAYAAPDRSFERELQSTAGSKNTLNTSSGGQYVVTEKYTVVFDDQGKVTAFGLKKQLGDSLAKRPNISIASVRRTNAASGNKIEFVITVFYALPVDLKEARIEAGISLKGSRNNFTLQDVDLPAGQIEISVVVPREDIDKVPYPTAFAILRKRSNNNQGIGNTLAEFWQESSR